MCVMYEYVNSKLCAISLMGVLRFAQAKLNHANMLLFQYVYRNGDEFCIKYHGFNDFADVLLMIFL